MEVHGSEKVLYLFGVIWRAQALPAREIEAIPFSSLVALVELVSASEFSSEVLEERLKCVDWVAPLARRHTAVLEDAMQYGPVVPARLCTLFSSVGALTSSLSQNEQRLTASLSRLAGREEWGIKIFCDEERLSATIAASDPEAQALETRAAMLSPGQAYVLRKRRDRYLAELVSLRIDEVADEALDSLGPLAVAQRSRPLLSERRTMVLNLALLVEITEELHTTVGDLALRYGAEGFVIDLTGPWPPYSFCDAEDFELERSEEEATR